MREAPGGLDLQAVHRDDARVVGRGGALDVGGAPADEHRICADLRVDLLRRGVAAAAPAPRDLRLPHRRAARAAPAVERVRPGPVGRRPALAAAPDREVRRVVAVARPGAAPPGRDTTRREVPLRADDPAALAATGRSVIRLDAAPHPLRLEIQGCPTPGCWCADGTAVAVELAPDPTRARTLRVVVDLRTGERRPSDPPPPGLEAAADELARALPAEVRAGALARLRARRDRELDGFVLDRAWVGQGGLWPFSHLLRGGTPDEPQYRGLLDRFRSADGHPWSVQDLYCPRPGCDCREVTLSFDREDGASFTVRHDFGSTPAAVADARGLPSADALAVYAAWSATSERADRPRFAARYRALREQVARAAAPPPRPPPAKAPRPPPPAPGIGPNTPCPCGSGKKYKRCHGAAA